MLKNMLSSALIAGVAAGLIAALLQFVFVQPVLLHAELYEGGELVHFEGVIEDHGHEGEEGEGGHSHAHSHGGGDVEGIDWVRDGLSVLFTMLVYGGYGLLMVAGFVLAEQRGHVLAGPRDGLLWGLAGFIAVQFAPAAGLPPELPGMAAAEVVPRQIWWLATVAATAVGLWLIAFGRGWGAWAAAIVLIVLPHLIGAPHPHELTGPTPPELASQFAGRALGVGLAAWVILGLFAAALWSRARV